LHSTLLGSFCLGEHISQIATGPLPCRKPLQPSGPWGFAPTVLYTLHNCIHILYRYIYILLLPLQHLCQALPALIFFALHKQLIEGTSGGQISVTTMDLLLDLHSKDNINSVSLTEGHNNSANKYEQSFYDIDKMDLDYIDKVEDSTPQGSIIAAPMCRRRGVPLFFGCSQPRARALVTRFGLVFVFRHLGHHGLILDFRVSDFGVVRPALLAPGCVVMDTRSLHRLEAWSSAGAPLRRHTCSQLHHPALLTQD
jgi:hypothetical protein